MGVYFFVRVVEVQSSCTCMVTFGAQKSNLFDAVQLSLSLMKIPEMQIHAVIWSFLAVDVKLVLLLFV